MVKADVISHLYGRDRYLISNYTLFTIFISVKGDIYSIKLYFMCKQPELSGNIKDYISICLLA